MLCKVRQNTDGGWSWWCPQDANICRAEMYETHGKSMIWEVAVSLATEHAHYFHESPVHLTHDMGTPPGGFHLGDMEATVSLPVIIGHTHTMTCGHK